MTYKKQFTLLSSVIAGLALIYTLTVIFDPERVGSRSDAYSWLDASTTDRVSGITIARPDETITLARNGGRWFVSQDGKDYPARDIRVEDFIAALSKRAPYPVRSSSASSHERLSLNEGAAVRVTIAAGAGLPLLNLLIGQPDITGQNIYLRKQGQNEARSGEDIFSSYTNASLTSWYNLRLIPETETGKLDAASVQRLTVYPPADDGAEAAPQIFTRKGKEWDFNSAAANPDIPVEASVDASIDASRVEGYIRDILNTAGNDFAAFITPSDPMFNYSRLILELGDGSTRTLRVSAPDTNGIYYAAVSGSDWVYALAGWMGERLFVDDWGSGE